jgi:hypothetical protein
MRSNFWYIKLFFRRQRLKRLGLIPLVIDGIRWFEGPGGWRVTFCNGDWREPSVLYCEGNRSVCFDTYPWHESQSDREADTTTMSDRERFRWHDRKILRIIVPDNLTWSIDQSDSLAGKKNFIVGEMVSSEERDRIFANIEMAEEFGTGKKPQFVR